MKVIVLGAGLIGFEIARELAADSDFQVTAADVSAEALKELSAFGVKGVRADLSSSKDIQKLVSSNELVVNALPGNLGYESLKAAIEAQRNVVDIAFYPEDPFTLDEAAKDAGVSVVVDCGLAPGLTNLLVGHLAAELSSLESVMIYVGGLPQERKLPFEYKAVFSPRDVIEEYLRPARVVDNGSEVVKAPLTEREMLYFPGVGDVEAFNTDGLRTLLDTVSAKTMREKTIRYPGHADKIQFLKDVGLLNESELNLSSAKLAPIELTSELLFDAWRFGEGDRDVTLMRVSVEGEKSGEKIKVEYELVDYFDEVNEVSSMARTTGYTAVAVARLLSKGLISKAGVIAPEHLGKDAQIYRSVIEFLESKSVSLSRSQS